MTGKVIDHQENPLAGAVVYISNTRTRAVKTYIVGQDGTYRFPALSPLPALIVRVMVGRIELLSPERLEKLAKNQNLVTPQSGQVVHLDVDKPESSVAMVVK